jgi:hypothetical protein
MLRSKQHFGKSLTRNFPDFSWKSIPFALAKRRSLKNTDALHPVRNQMTRERRETRRRLRHCNGLQTSKATDAGREGGSEAKSGSQDTDLIVLVVAEESLKRFNGLSGQLLRQREG